MTTVVTKLSALPLLAYITLIMPLQAAAQETQTPATPPPAQWCWGPGPWHMWPDGYGRHFWWMGPLMMLFMFLLCVVVIRFLFAHRPWGDGLHHRWSPPTYSALQILNERFARGEIQKNEFEDKKAAILSGGQH